MWSKAEDTDAAFKKFASSSGTPDGFRPIELFEGVSQRILHNNYKKLLIQSAR